jgi:hypothetical protein
MAGLVDPNADGGTGEKFGERRCPRLFRSGNRNWNLWNRTLLP